MATASRVLRAYFEHKSAWKAGAEIGISGQRVHQILKEKGISAVGGGRAWTPTEESVLRTEYAAAASSGNLQALAEKLGRTRQYICRKARGLGLTDLRRKKPWNALQPDDLSLFAACHEDASDAEIGKRFGVGIAGVMRRRKILGLKKDPRRRWLINPHPRGALGMKHTEEARALIGIRSRAAWQSMTEERIVERSLKMQRTRVSRGTQFTERTCASWKAAWREIGGVRKFYRSRWEANYARYLQWLKETGHISGWEHEPKTFWFDGVKRGCVSYLPDFRVDELGGAESYHEVKGWMDDRSKTKIRRMAKYHPGIRLVVIEAKAYRELQQKVASMIHGWER